MINLKITLAQNVDKAVDSLAAKTETELAPPALSAEVQTAPQEEAEPERNSAQVEQLVMKTTQAQKPAAAVVVNRIPCLVAKKSKRRVYLKNDMAKTM